jgi:hypothetical protein
VSLIAAEVKEKGRLWRWNVTILEITIHFGLPSGALLQLFKGRKLDSLLLEHLA